MTSSWPRAVIGSRHFNLLIRVRRSGLVHRGLRLVVISGEYGNWFQLGYVVDRTGLPRVVHSAAYAPGYSPAPGDQL